MKKCLKCESICEMTRGRKICRICYNMEARLKARENRSNKSQKVYKSEAKEKQCAGCRCMIFTQYAYCGPCSTISTSRSKNGMAHYNYIEPKVIKEIFEFIRRIKLRGLMVDFLDMIWIIEYYQVTHKLIYKYDNKSSAQQIKEMWLDLLIWQEKQIDPKAAYHKRSRYDEYKRLSK